MVAYILYYTCLFVYIYINGYPIFYIQYGDIPIRTPSGCPTPPGPICGGPDVGSGGVGGGPSVYNIVSTLDVGHMYTCVQLLEIDQST